ncbi:DUF3089 domain-containing protein [Sphingomonas ginkgonis]|nr:DUF3089 domain-containing protein [Sphingomonas ginkgonis]
MSVRHLTAALALVAAGPALAQAPQPAQRPVPTDYSTPTHWICLPGRKDVCSTPLATTPLTAAGYGPSAPSPVAANPPVDCFYVYPTVSRDPGMNSDLSVSDNEERYAVQSQFARFSGVCRPFAPAYRQMTLGAVAAVAAGTDVKPYAMIAYADVAAAFRTYLQRYNQGRPFVLVGHSQGSLMLQYLIVHEIEGRPVQKQLLLALIPGFNVYVPQGRRMGGTFRSVPLCGRPGETGCVVAYSSFREKNEPPAGAMFGTTDQPGMTVGCVNPASPGSTDWQRLSSDWYARAGNPVPGGPISWSSTGTPPTPWLSTSGLVSGRCVQQGGRGFLSIRTNSRPGEKWTDHVGGEVGALGFFLPGWGMHLNDVNFAQGDLVRLVASVTPRSGTASRPTR